MIKETLKELKQMQNELYKRKETLTNELKEIDYDLFLIENVIRMKNGEIPIVGKSIDSGLSKKDIPSKYDVEDFQENKIIYAISILKQATVKQLAEYMNKQEKGSDYKALYARAQQVVIRLTKENKLIKSGEYASKYRLNIVEK